MLIKLFRRYLQENQALLLVGMCSVLFLASAYLYVQVLATPPSGDEPHFLIISQTLLKYHSLNVMLDYNHGDYHLFYPLYIAPHVASNAQGQLLPLHSIGGPVLWLIPYYFLGRLGAVFFISLVSVLIILNINKFLLAMHISKRYAFIVSFAYAVASPVYIYSHLTFIEPIGALICIYALRKIFQNDLKISDLLISSTLLGILPWVHIRFAFFEVILFFALLYKIRAARQAASLSHSSLVLAGDRKLSSEWNQIVKYYVYYLLPVTVLFVLFEIYNYKVWGSLNPGINEVNDIHGGSKPFVVAPFNGILGVFFDQEYGLIVNFPVFLFLFIGVALAIKRQFMSYNLLMFLLSIPYIILFTTFKDWPGGWSPPARFIFVLLPLYSFYLAYALERINNILSSFVLGISIAYGTIYNILSTVPFLRDFNGGTGRNRALEGVQLFHHHLTDFLPSLFLPNQTPLFIAWVGLCVALSLLLIGSRARNRSVLGQ